MSDSDGHGYVTFGWVATIIGVLSVGALGQSYKTSEYYGAHYEEKCAEQHEKDAAISSNVAPVTGGEKAGELTGDKEPKPNWCDLAAQYHMADSAMWTNRATWATFGFTVLGVFLIWRTLEATRGTLREAKDTTRAATAATAEAVTANAIAKKSVDASLESTLAIDRPWIKIVVKSHKALVFGEKEISIKLEVKIENIGRSPAHHVRMATYEMHPTIFAAKSQAQRIISKQSALNTNLFGLGTVMFPGDYITKTYECMMPTANFKDAIDNFVKHTEGEESIAADSHVSYPGILLGVFYLIGGSAAQRHTFMPYEVRVKDNNHAGWNGSEMVIDPDLIGIWNGSVSISGEIS